MLSINLNPNDSMKQALLLIALSLLVAACGGGKDDAAPDTAKKDTTATSSSGTSSTSESSTDGSSTASTGSTANAKKYEVKSGIVEMKNSMMGGTTTLYFDDFGAKQATHVAMEMMGQKSENVQIMSGGWNLSYDTKTKKGMKMKVPANAFGGGPVPSPADLSDSLKKAYHYKELEDREILGKPAKGYSMSAMGMDVKVWTWNNVPLYMEMGTGKGQPMVMEATKIETDVDIPADKFEVPEDVTLEEMSATMPQTNPTLPGK